MAFPMSKLERFWINLRSSLWILPTLIVGGSIVMGLALIELGTHVDDEVWDRFPWLFGAEADGARGMLTAIATSMITVAGVIFSITMVVLSLASNQYSPRILRNFRRDRFNQVVLGTFLGIFTYCLVVVRTIRGGDEDPFVPPLAVLGSVVLALVGVAVLIAFIHHIVSAIQAEKIIAGAAAETQKSIDHLFPESMGEEFDDDSRELSRFLAETDWHPIRASQSGYTQHVDGEDLMRLAEEHETVVRMEQAVGSFCIEGSPIAWLAGDRPPDEGTVAAFRSMFSLSRSRTVEQDAAFGILQIVDVALKALSPSINETTTAVTCINHLSVLGSRLASRRIEGHQRARDGRLRVIAVGPTYRSLIDRAFEEIRRNASGNVEVLDHLLRALEAIGSFTEDAGRRRHLIAHVRSVAEVVDRTVESPSDRDVLAASVRRVLRALGDADAEGWTMGELIARPPHGVPAGPGDHDAPR